MGLRTILLRSRDNAGIRLCFQGGVRRTRQLNESLTIRAYGRYAGYNWQMREWLIGIEGDAAWSNMDGSRSVANVAHLNASTNWLASIRLRGGYSIDTVLVYATAGIAFADADARISVGGASVEDTDNLTGYVVGGGVEMKFASNVSGRIEGLYYGFGERSLDLGGVTIPFDASTATVRAGITFHFN